jgi:multicomponent Na+:H+ antiporter subunit D
VPLLAAALLVATGHVVSRRVQNAVAIAAAAAMTAFSVLVLVSVQGETAVHWFGGWHPAGGVPLGIVFAADSLGAGIAALASTLVLLVLVYSSTYMRDESHTYDALVLTFGAGMAGFALTGDIFNMFVWFELMGVSAYALAAFKIEELGPLQGALNFAITNTVGAYMILTGIGLLYARTGALNLAQIGRELAGHRPDRLVVVAFCLIVVGLMVKAAIVPFHFWLADAHAASPAPVCVLLSGVMVELGIFFLARVYWTVFSGSFDGDTHAVETMLVGFGTLTALVGALMCLLQRHLKRLLAYSTISHAGVMLTGVALLDPRSLGGVAVLVLAHGFLKGGLFLAGGIVLVALGNVDELRLHGRGRGLPVLGSLWFAGTLGLVAIPYLGVSLGHELMGEGARAQGYGWLAAVATVTTAVCAGAMLRAGARVFLGWGPDRDDLLTPEPDEAPPSRTANMPLLLAVTGVTIAIGLAMSLVPGLEQRAELAAERFVDRTAYSARVLHDVTSGAPNPSVSLSAPSATAVAYGLGALAIALLTAAFGLWHGRLPARVRRPSARVAGPPVELVRHAHSGIVGDYLLWLVGATVLIGSVWSFSI